MWTSLFGCIFGLIYSVYLLFMSPQAKFETKTNILSSLIAWLCLFVNAYLNFSFGVLIYMAIFVIHSIIIIHSPKIH